MRQIRKGDVLGPVFRRLKGNYYISYCDLHVCDTVGWQMVSSVSETAAAFHRLGCPSSLISDYYRSRAINFLDLLPSISVLKYEAKGCS
jgi:hypothetical protein